MQLVRFGILIFSGFFIISSSALAQDSTDYNDSIKQQLKSEDTPVTPPKKVVRKRIRKADQSAKIAAQKKAMAKNVKVAQTESNVSKVNSEPVVSKPVLAAREDENFEAPSLGESAVHPSQPTGVQVAQAQPAPYQPIFILQPVPQAQAQAPVPAATAGPQVQPTTNVDAASVPEPRSEQLRRQREDLEHQTESKLIEKLEDDRLTSEKERADRILKPAATPTPAPTAAPVAEAAPVVTPVVAVEPDAAPVSAVVPPATSPTAAAKNAAPISPAPVAPAASATAAMAVAPAPAPVPAPVPQVVGDSSTTSAAAMSGETKSSTEDIGKSKEEDEHKFSLGALGGLPSYPGVGNIQAFYAIGALGDYRFSDHLSLQASFEYSTYNISNAYYCPFCFGGTLIKGMNQYDVGLGLNYHPITFGMLSPVVGILLDYARRNYYDKVDYGYTYGTPSGSNAFDAGLMAGVDLKLTKQLILGFQFSYLWNISYWTDNPLAYGFYGPIYGSPIESLSYYIAALNLRFLF